VSTRDPRDAGARCNCVRRTALGLWGCSLYSLYLYLLSMMAGLKLVGNEMFRDHGGFYGTRGAHARRAGAGRHGGPAPAMFRAYHPQTRGPRGLSSKDLPVNGSLRSLHLPLLPRAPSPWLPEGVVEQAGPPRGSASITAVTVHKGGILSNTLKEHSREPPRSQAAHESSPGKMVQVR
jgi:hypothetical protein